MVLCQKHFQNKKDTRGAVFFGTGARGRRAIPPTPWLRHCISHCYSYAPHLVIVSYLRFFPSSFIYLEQMVILMLTWTQFERLVTFLIHSNKLSNEN